MNFDNEFEKAIRMVSKAMPLAEELIKPTLLHSIRVGMYLYNNGYNREISIAGLLHDVIEDTKLVKKDIIKNFGNEIYDLIDVNSKNYSLEKTQRGPDSIRRCAEHSEAALIIKTADVMDNIYYFSKIKRLVSVDKMIFYAKLILKCKPKNYHDKIFKELNKIIK